MRAGRAAGIALVCAALAACGSTAPQTPTPAAATTPSPSPDLTPVPVASPSLASTRAAAAAVAQHVAEEWVAAQEARDFKAAWALLARRSHEAYGSFDNFAADRNAFLDTAKDKISGPSLDLNPQSLGEWLPDAPGAVADEAFVATVTYPELEKTNGSLEILVVAPDETGAWRIWHVR